MHRSNFLVSRGQFSLKPHIPGGIMSEYIQVLQCTVDDDLSGRCGTGQIFYRVMDIEDEGIGERANIVEALLCNARLSHSDDDPRDKNERDHSSCSHSGLVSRHKPVRAVPDGIVARDPIGRAIAVSETINKEHPNNLKILGELSDDLNVSGRIGYPGDSAANQKVLEDYRRALAVDESAIKIKPDDVPFLHGYSIDLSNVGGKIEASDPLEALNNYKKALEIDRRLTQLSTDIRYQRGVAIAYGSIASVYDDVGDYPDSFENNMKGLAIYQDLVHADPKNVLLRQGIAITYTNTSTSCLRVGKIALALDYSNRGLEIIQSLASSGPRNAFQQYVFAAILSARGTILTAANQPVTAITELEHGRAIYESLYKAGNTNHANIAAADVKLGEAAAKAGRDQDAADCFHQALTIVEPLISSAPADLDAKYAAADAYSGLGDLSMTAARHPGFSLERRKSSWTEARSWYVLSQNTWHSIDHPNHTAPNFFMVGDPAVVAKNLKLAETALASFH